MDQLELVSLITNLVKSQANDRAPVSSASLHRMAITDTLRQSRTISDSMKLKATA